MSKLAADSQRADGLRPKGDRTDDQPHAGMLITTEAAVAEIPEDKPAPMNGGGGMGGMGGMDF